MSQEDEPSFPKVLLYVSLFRPRVLFSRECKVILFRFQAVLLYYFIFLPRIVRNAHKRRSEETKVKVQACPGWIGSSGILRIQRSRTDGSPWGSKSCKLAIFIASWLDDRH